MRRLSNSRDNLPDDGALQGFDSLVAEGDLLTPPPDAIGSLRPFGGDLPEQRLGTILVPDGSAGGPELERAAALAVSGRRLDAIALLRQVIEEQPTAVEARISLAQLHGSVGDFEEAIDELTRRWIGVPRSLRPWSSVAHSMHKPTREPTRNGTFAPPSRRTQVIGLPIVTSALPGSGKGRSGKRSRCFGKPIPWHLKTPSRRCSWGKHWWPKASWTRAERSCPRRSSSDPVIRGATCCSAGCWTDWDELMRQWPCTARRAR